MAVGKQSLNRVAKTGTVANAAPEVVQAAVKSVPAQATAKEKPAPEKGQNKASNRIYKVGDALPFWLL